ncbi:putative TELO2-interacting protein [Cocos nucifera]|uniref:Putative TELO2-interacting protein n=1 Tax=Cocos nucifera TaxID=13894 RepID=A0A8K0ILR4_COCNU|nr:putative TELO2-interacting protein [Cocos nucifera]
MAGLREEGGIPGDETLERVFSRLKPYCVDLLELVRNPKKKASFLPEMTDFLRHAPPDALQPCLDYTLFPLLLLLDAAVECRKEQKADSYESLGNGGAPLRGLEISDSVAEGVLTCIEELLKKCHLGSVNQMVVVLKKLTSGALLSPSEASEEFREGIIKCFSTLQTEHATSVRYFLEPEECLLAFLRSQNASAAVGHWLSLLLQVGTADALAFFLPGIVSRFAKVLYISKSMISGAAGSTASIEHAVCGLTEFLMIVLNDEANLCGLEMSINDISGFFVKESRSTQSVLEVLRHLPVSSQNQSKNPAGKSSNQSITVLSSKDELKETSDHYGHDTRSLYVHRTKGWIDETSANVDKLLSATFPHLSVHPAEKVRKALVDGIAGLLSNCSYTLKKSKLMLLVRSRTLSHFDFMECLCVLVCDDSVVVSVAAQESLESLFMVGEKFLTEDEISEIFTSLIERLPRVILGSEETVALSYAQRLLALMYYAGPKLVTNHLLCSPIKAARFLDCLSLSLSHNSQFAGSVNKIISSKPLSVGYLLSVAELKAGILMNGASHSIDSPSASINSKISLVQDKDLENMVENGNSGYEFPHMPPWFLHIGNHRLYVALAGILRLVGLSMTAGHRSDVSLSVLMDILLDYFHKLISDLRIRAYNKESWQSWYSRSGSGKLLRQTSVAVCMLNEMIYGLSDQSVSLNSKQFMKKGAEIEEAQGVEFTCNNDQSSGFRNDGSAWKVRQEKDTRDHVIHCVGSILHEYMSPEVWDLPIDQKSPLLEHEIETDISLHFFRDAAMLHQEIYCYHLKHMTLIIVSCPVIIDGIGVFSIVLGKDFVCSGFMHSSIYLLLQNLICSNNQIRNASDAVLRALAASCSYPTVGHLVVANADYIVDSLCRQLRHLDLNPHVPDVIAAMLSYIGAAHDILPLLEEPV